MAKIYDSPLCQAKFWDGGCHPCHPSNYLTGFLADAGLATTSNREREMSCLLTSASKLVIADPGFGSVMK